jgi:hypothetical protein
MCVCVMVCTLCTILRSVKGYEIDFGVCVCTLYTKLRSYYVRTCRGYDFDLCCYRQARGRGRYMF